jgi:UDP-N-acetylmuramate dehydrogenase
LIPFLKKLEQNSLSVKQHVHLARYTTMGVGGQADLFAEVNTAPQLEMAVTLAVQEGIPYLVLGRGSNVIISDQGYQGLVILNKAGHWQVLQAQLRALPKSKLPHRFKTLEQSSADNINLQYSDDDAEDIRVRVESGARMEIVIRDLLKAGITGLQWFAGIPSTIGGGVYMNLHGGDRYLGELVEQAYLTDGRSAKIVNGSYFQFDYDWSILHQTAETVLWVDLNLKKGDVQKARDLAKTWARLKNNQPRRSAGCIFRNLSVAEQQKHNLPTPSAGYLIDQVLNLKGKKCGGAVISMNHAAFIENTGNATAADVAELIRLIQQQTRDRLGFELKTEIQLIGKF